MNKRQWALLISAGLIAAILGIGLSSFKHRTTEAKDQAVELFLKEELKGPDGAIHATKEWRNKILVLNFWATWCPPCVEEMPLLDRFYQENKLKGWQILGIAIDQPSSVRRFQAQFPVSYPLVLGGLQGNEFGRLLGNEQGSLPYTLALDREGRGLQRKLGRLDASDLAAWK